MEWTPTWGAKLKFPEFQLRYVGRLQLGTGRPGAASPWMGFREGGQFGEVAVGLGDFLVAPTGSLVLQDAETITHQFYLVVPLRF